MATRHVARALMFVAMGLFANGCARAAEAQGRTCPADLAAIRALRSSAQRCGSDADCTVWHNGEYWDGCPVEVNVTNGRRLDAMRRAFEARGCRADVNGACGASMIRGCVRGTCGGF